MQRIGTLRQQMPERELRTGSQKATAALDDSATVITDTLIFVDATSTLTLTAPSNEVIAYTSPLRSANEEFYDGLVTRHHA